MYIYYNIHSFIGLHRFTDLKTHLYKPVSHVKMNRKDGASCTKTRHEKEKKGFVAVLVLTASVLKEINVTLQCVTCPFGSASMMSIKRRVTYRCVSITVIERLPVMWPLIQNTDAAFAD